MKELLPIQTLRPCKKYIIRFIFSAFIFLLFNSYYINAQNDWAPVGAKWYYTTPYLSNVRCTTIESIGDTVIKGKNCRKLEIHDNETHQLLSMEFIYQKNDSILYFNRDSFYLLYNFSASVGDTIAVHDGFFHLSPGFLYPYVDSVQGFSYKVLEIDTVQIDTLWLKRQKIYTLGDVNWGLGNFVTEKLGSDIYFFGRFKNITPEEQVGLLRCYNDMFFNYKNPEWTNECDYISLNHEITSSRLIKFYPNPANDKLFIETKIQGTLTIYNLNGQKIISKDISPGTNIIHISFLKPSIYYCRLLSEKGTASYKLLKVKK